MIAIIGAGACGLMLANILEKLNIKYTIFNKGKVGRKILASGNGRCNISNKIYDDIFYHFDPLAKKIVASNQATLFKLLRDMKIYTKVDMEGRMYPLSESSLSVLEILLDGIKGEIKDIEITNISKRENKYYLNNTLGPFDKVVLAMGSNASFRRPYPSLEALNSLNIKFNEFTPSLVGFRVVEKIKEISGVRAKVEASLYNKGRLIHKEPGEVIFKDDGISGICIMNLSSFYSRLKDKNNSYIRLNLSLDDYDSYKSVLHPKLYKYALNNNINIHNMILNIKGLYDMEFAQVAHGGIDSLSVNDNLSLRSDKNIYAGGEILDIDALCGGYNLMLAFTSAIVIGRSIKNEISNK